MCLGKVLVVEDEVLVQDLVRMYLENADLEVKIASDGEEAVAMVERLKPDLILLDIMLPKMDGWTVCREIRKTLTTPIIMLTSKGEEYDKILGLELGADDYISKPFSPREMVARVKAVLRRATMVEQSVGQKLKFNGLKLDLGGQKVEVYDNEIKITPKEFDLLWFLASHKGQVFNRDQLLENVWGYSYFGDPRTVDTHIKRLREKLENDTGIHYIKTVWGRGYKFEVSD